MKKILLLFGTLLLSVLGFTQTSIIITGETNPNPNQTYTYRINQFIGVSGTNATWKVTNGKFLNGSTTLVQNVDNTSVDVIWTKAGGTGTLSYSYQNGSSAGYAGFTSVNIKGDGSGSGGGAIQAPIDGPNNPKVGDIVYYKTNIDRFVNYQETRWAFSQEIFELLELKNDYIKLKVKSYGVAYINVEVRYSIPEILRIKGEKRVEIKPAIISPIYACDNEIVNCYIPHKDDAIIKWESTPTMTLISGQGTSTATYAVKKGLNGYGTIKAEVSYLHVDVIEAQVWVGVPAKPKIEGLLIGDYKPNTDYLLAAEYKKDTDSFNWRVVGGATLMPGIDGAYSQKILRTDNLLPNRTTSFSIYLTATNRCGTSPQLIENGYVVAGDLPDPGGVELASDPKFVLQSVTATAPVSVKVYSFNTGTMVYREKNVTGFNIQNTTLKDGIYIVVTTDQNGETKSEKVIKTGN